MIRCNMGAVFGPRDISKGRKRIIENALTDIHPDVRVQILNLLASWEGAMSEERLKQIMGKEKAKKFLDDIKLDG